MIGIGCRGELEAAVKENVVLKAELAAVDPEFFEQVEDLKHAHHVLQQEHAEIVQRNAELHRKLGAVQ